MSAQPPLGPEEPVVPEPFFHLASGTVRFWVLVGDQYVGSSIRNDILHYRYHPNQTDDDPLATYAENAAELHAAVQRRVAKGSIEPVMLRGPDLQAVPAS
jgi:hypothetical protein